MAMEIRLNRPGRVYRPGEAVTGVLVISTSSSISHNGITLLATGQVRPHVTAASSGFFDSVGSAAKVVEVSRTEVLLTRETIPSGRTDIPFEFVLEPLPGQSLVETYHGVYINVVYDIKCVMVRGGFKKDLATDLEYIVEVPSKISIEPEPLEFEIRPDTLENVKKSSISAIPSFLVKGSLHMTNCYIERPFTGEVTVNHSESIIKSIELQLVRVETVHYAEGTAKEATEIQNLQLAEGHVTCELGIPIYMLFPRLFTCPTTKSDTFSVEFEVNVIVVFEDHYMVTENFPLVLVR